MITPIKIMGILNVTPDSFYDGGRHADRDAAVAHALSMADDGAAIIDVGGESTRPGAASVSTDVEMARVIPVIESLAERLAIPLSIDTTKAVVAGAALRAGATIINDVSAGTFDPAILDVAANYGATVVLMHINGAPPTMQRDPRYDDLLGDIEGFLTAAVERALGAGIARDRIILDPGIGFGKTLEDNYRIIANLPRFKRLGFPLLVGLSRKSLIGNVVGEGADRLPATIALNAAAVLGGADIIRVHDVREHRLALAGIEMLRKVS